MSRYQTSEESFETAIELSLITDGGYSGLGADLFDQEKGLFPATIIEFIKETQPDTWDYLYKIQGDKTAQIGALIGKVESSIGKLKEYSSALITAAVTGKIDVRKEGI